MPRRTGWAEAEVTSRRINARKDVWFIIVAKFGVYIQVSRSFNKNLFVYWFRM